MVNFIGSSSGGTGSVQNLLQAMQKGEKNILETVAEDIQASVTAQAGGASNLMSRNFTSTDSEPSKYVASTLDGIKASRQMSDKQDNALSSILQTARIQAQNASSAGEAYKAAKRAEKMIAWHQATEVSEAAQDGHLKETKKKIEEKAQEALASGNDNGNPTVGRPSESTAPAAPTADTSLAAPVSGSGNSSFTDTATSTGAQTESASAQVAPTTPSLNIVV